MAGGVDKAFVGRLNGALAALPRRPVPATRLAQPPTPKGLEVTIVEKPADSTAISLGFPIDVTRRDDDFYALAVANSYLGEHRTFNGKLMQDLRGKRGLNYGDYSYIEDFIQEGMSTFPVPNNPRRQQDFTVWVRPVPHDKAAFALRRTLGGGPPASRTGSVRTTSRRPGRTCSITASSGPDALPTPRLRDGRPFYDRRRPRHRAGPTGCPKLTVAGQRGRPPAPPIDRASRSRS